MNRLSGFILIFSVAFISVSAQESTVSSKCGMKGYLSALPSFYWFDDSSAWQVLLHNRINVDWYPDEKLSGSVQLRNQIISGDFIEASTIQNGFKKENYFLPLTLQQNLGSRYLLSLSVDRAWVQYTHNKLEVIAGRQRINWSQTFVWNANDLFNTYNFFDFDYPERPGADAIRIQYYTGYTSSLDLAAKLDSAGKVTAGALYHFNRWNTDFQFMAGYYSKTTLSILADTLPAFESSIEDLVGGFGFSGALGNMSLRGEMSYFYALTKGSNSENQFLGSMALDYSFPDQTYLMVEFFYNSRVLLSGNSFLNFYGGNQDIKSMTYTRYNAFGQASYPVSPLVNATLAVMYFWDDFLKGGFAGPSVEISLGDNVSVASFFQFFAFKIDLPAYGTDRANINLAFLRLKWSF
jgi:hypothetical protein